MLRLFRLLMIIFRLFVDLLQFHAFKKFFLNEEVVAFSFRKMVQESNRSAISQGINQSPQTATELLRVPDMHN